MQIRKAYSFPYTETACCFEYKQLGGKIIDHRGDDIWAGSSGQEEEEMILEASMGEHGISVIYKPYRRPNHRTAVINTYAPGPNLIQKWTL